MGGAVNTRSEGRIVGDTAGPPEEVDVGSIVWSPDGDDVGVVVGLT
jgi:hypothetical protein